MSNNSHSKSKSANVKLRAACNLCNAAKVKCTGDRSGCTRCQHLSLQCIYTESRVGKVPGTRAKKNRRPVEHNAADTADPTGPISVDQQPGQTTTTTTTAERPPIHSNLVNSDLDWMDDFQNPYENGFGSMDGVTFESIMSDFDPTDEGRRNTTSSHESSVASPDENDISQSGESIMPTAGAFHRMTSQNGLSSNEHTRIYDTTERLPNRTTLPKPGAGQPPTEQKQSYKNVDSHCVLACTEIINNLERYVLAELKALDLCLTIVRPANEDLRRLVDTQKASRNFRCMALFSVIMYQIVELFEVGCAAFILEGIGGPEKMLPEWLRSGGTSGLGLGAFRMGAKEQRAWRTDIVLKDVQQSVEILQSIVTLARLGPRQACQDTPDERASCYSELECRFAVLQKSLLESK